MSVKDMTFQEILNGLERSDARVIPGTKQIEGVEIVYFSDDGKSSFRKQFKNLTSHSKPSFATDGGVNERGCRITSPDGELFHAIGYHRDIEGWRKDIEIGAHGLNLRLARIEGDSFLVSDGRAFPLSACKVEFC